MRQISTNLLIFLGLLIGFSSTTYAAGPSWPLKGEVDFSSGFGDFRQDRFHSGLDLRTGGAIGQPVYAPVSGFVSRVKMSYYGYGKGLYFTGSDGRLYVFGHLSRFSPKLDSLIKSIQLAHKRYYIDSEFPKDSIAVVAGELLAYSGQTGSGAPHLHFEERTADNRPLNPFTHGFETKDKIPPSFNAIGFQMTDLRSLFVNGERRLILPVRGNKKGNVYTLDTVLAFNRPFGLLADCFDRTRPDGMKQAVYRLTVTIDDSVQYDAVLDTLPFESGIEADFVYDYAPAMEGRASVRCLYNPKGTKFAGVRKLNASDGVIGLGSALSIGRHVGRIQAQDAFGNTSELRFTFLWGPADRLYTLDSTATPNDSTTIFHFAPTAGIDKLGIDSVVVYLNRGTEWGITPSAHVQMGRDGRLTVRVHGFQVPVALLKLAAWTKEKGALEDPPFNGWTGAPPKHGDLSIEVVEDGLFVTALLPSRRGAQGHLEFYFRDSLLGKEVEDRYFSMQDFRWFIPALPEYARIDRIEFIWADDTTHFVLAKLDSLNIVRITPDQTTELRADTLFSVTFPPNAVVEPRFVALGKHIIVNKLPLRLNSEHYQVLPGSLILRNPFSVTLRPYNGSPDSTRTALYRLDTLKNRWNWITDSTDHKEKIFGTSRNGGSFAAVYDDEPPAIRELSIKDLDVIPQVRPVITFKVVESGSGIADDRNFSIKIDDKWQIPEYDPETGICQTQPLLPLAVGAHRLSVEVRDRAGNEGQEYLRFDIRPASPKKGK